MTSTRTHETVDLLIVGSGPAGISTALHLVRSDPRWARRLVVVDRAVHPREKLCGGGVTRSGEEVLRDLGLGFPEGHVSIRELRLVFGDRGWAVRGEPVFRVVRRAELDHWLVRAAEREGIEVRQGERVEDLAVAADAVEVRTERATYRARVLVGADGSKGTVRRRLGWAAGARQARLLEVLTPERPDPGDHAVAGSPWRGVAVFDFTPMTEGVHGYYWDFPSLVGGRPMMNRGVFDSRIGRGLPRRPLKEILEDALVRRGRTLEDGRLAGHPILWFDRGARVAGERVLLAGDAAGVDPLFGEGISFALRHGRVAAEAVADAFGRNDFGFAGYRERLLEDPLLGHLPRRKRVARVAYALGGALGWWPLWSLVPWAARALMSYRPGILPLEDGRLERVRAQPEELRTGA
ncbi:MAG: FAD-dependent monooxygenase [Acidobacteriota bacterium]|jgi:flavin-dependent dehydrogenase